MKIYRKHNYELFKNFQFKTGRELRKSHLFEP